MSVEDTVLHVEVIVKATASDNLGGTANTDFRDGTNQIVVESYSILLHQLVSVIVYLSKNKLIPPMLVLIYLLITDLKPFFLSVFTMLDILLIPVIIALELILAQWQLKERFIL